MNCDSCNRPLCRDCTSHYCCEPCECGRSHGCPCECRDYDLHLSHVD